jgi:glycerophosphoryl diester phosphodiesterase
MIGFAHRGAPRDRSEENTLAAFRRALSLGAGGIESDVLLTADGVPVLVHAGISLRGPRIADLKREELPEQIPTLRDLYQSCGSDFDLALDMAAPTAAAEVVSIAGEFGAIHRLWLTYWHLPALAAWRESWPDVRLVYPAMPLGRRRSTRLIARLASLGIDALNVHHRFCTAQLVEQAHRDSLLLFVWGIKDGATLGRVATKGVDGVFCDDAPALARLSD